MNDITNMIARRADNTAGMTCPNCQKWDTVRVMEISPLTGLQYIIKAKIACLKCGQIFTALLYKPKNLKG